MSYTTPPPTTNYRIPVLRTAAGAYHPIRDNPRLAIAMAWLPAALMVAAELVDAPIRSGSPFGPLWAGLLTSTIFLVFGSILAVRWYRFLLLGEMQISGVFPPAFGRFLIIEIKFLLLVLLSVFLSVLPVVALAIAVSPPLTTPLGVAVGVIISFLALQVSLVFPAASVGHPIGFGAAWDLLAGNRCRLIATAFVAYLPIALVGGLLTLGEQVTAPIATLFQAAGVLVTVVGGAVGTGIFAEIYRNVVAVEGGR